MSARLSCPPAPGSLEAWQYLGSVGKIDNGIVADHSFKEAAQALPLRAWRAAGPPFASTPPPNSPRCWAP